MDDLISRVAAIVGFYEMASDIDHLCTVGDYVSFLESLPAQPEVIRCKDCKYYYFADNRVPSEQSWVCDAWGVDQTAHMGYCYKAERRTDG